jgi:hypothetical protein
VGALGISTAWFTPTPDADGTGPRELALHAGGLDVVGGVGGARKVEDEAVRRAAPGSDPIESVESALPVVALIL